MLSSTGAEKPGTAGTQNLHHPKLLLLREKNLSFVRDHLFLLSREVGKKQGTGRVLSLVYTVIKDFTYM
jgi:hypothetical protein